MFFFFLNISSGSKNMQVASNGGALYLRAVFQYVTFVTVYVA